MGSSGRTLKVATVRIDEEGIVDEGGWDMLAVADGIVFGCPTHMGGPSWRFKRFADTSIRAWRPTQWRDKLATNPFDDPQEMSPADLATAAAFGNASPSSWPPGKPRTPPISTSLKLAPATITAMLRRSLRLSKRPIGSDHEH
jgi:hypothetical protein